MSYAVVIVFLAEARSAECSYAVVSVSFFSNAIEWSFFEFHIDDFSKFFIV